MKKYLFPLQLKDYLTLTVVVIIGFGWLLVDQVFLPEVYQRLIAFIVLIFVMYYIQFAVNKPVMVFRYANSIAIITLLFIVIVSLVMHVLIRHDFSYKSILIWLITGLLPYVTGYIYQSTLKGKVAE
jgi:hypothetical protein